MSAALEAHLTKAEAATVQAWQDDRQWFGVFLASA